MDILGIIPARYASTRFPGKPLADIAGISMIERVYRQTDKARMISKVLVATDDRRIQEHVLDFGGNVVMTKEDHPSGTDRCFEAFSNLDESFDFIVNVQGDEPFISPHQIDEICQSLDATVELATLVKKIETMEEIMDANEAKVVLNSKNEALYFSRSPIPYLNSDAQDWSASATYYKHVGIYAYRPDILELITKLQVSSLEKAESLEQLRWIQNGLTVKTATTEFESMCIDTPSDIEEAITKYEL